MFAGIDFGTSMGKVVYGANADELAFISQHVHLDEASADEFVELIFKLVESHKISRVATTGSRAGVFGNTVEAWAPLLERTDPIRHEIETSVRGTRWLLKEEVGADEFLLVSIGTGTSFTLVRGNDIIQYEPGLCVGSRTIVQLARSRGIFWDQIDALALRGFDPDLLMKDVFTASYPFGEFVIASMGRLSSDVASTDENFCTGLVKMIATPTMGHVLTILKNPEFRWNGPIVFIGSPVSNLASLRHWLLHYTKMLGMRTCMPPQGSFAGAIGAWLRAAEVA